MEPSVIRARIRDDLRRTFRGDLLLDGLSRTLYSTDASLFQVEPLGVAVPRDEADLCRLIRYAHERSIPVIPRGAGTGLAGESLGPGLVIDLSTHFQSILEVGDDWARVEPGVVLSRLNARLRDCGRRFAPDPASGVSCTIGGMIATDASGSRAAVHGSTRDHVRHLRVVWDDGTADDLHVPGAAGREPQPRTAELRSGVASLLRANRDLIAENRPKPTFSRCGYRLYDIVSEGDPDLVRLLVGTEGTLAITTAAMLRTVPLPGGRSAVALGFQSLDAALDAGLRARALSPAACEVLDRRLIAVARTQAAAGTPPIRGDLEAALFVEFERESPAEAREAVGTLMAVLSRGKGRPAFTVEACDDRAIDDLWGVRVAALPYFHGSGQGRRPVPLVDDIGVAPDDIPVFVTRANSILRKFETASSLLVHVATGHVHLRPHLDPEHDADRMWPMAEELYGLALELGGTISARHGTGLARTPWVERQFGPAYPVFRRLKALFDPRGILNPGKIVDPDPSRPAWPLRTAVSVEPVPTRTPSEPPAESRSSTPRTPLLVWETDEFARAMSACNGCGACREEESTERMCPTFRATHAEAAAPRAKIALMRALLEGRPQDVSADDLRGVANLCVNCRMCASECPGRADIPKLMLEAKAVNHAAHGLRRADWFLARFDGLAALGSRFALTANLLLGRRTVRWAMEKVFDLARRRTLPAFAFRSFLARARRRGLHRRPEGGPAVAFFVDTYANVFDPAVAEATVAVLRHNGVPVYVPAGQRGCGAAALAQGDTDVARERLLRNVNRLADAARAGDTIVCSEPTAALFFRIDALGLSAEPEVRLVAERTVELTTFLWSLYEQGRLRTDFQPLDFAVGHHVPCHVKALGGGAAGPALLSLIPHLRASKIDVSCSGMAGTFGLGAKNLPVSLAAGKPMLDEFARPRHQYGSSECSACRLQMQEGTGKRAAHPVQYLALAYGLMPSVADRLRRPFGGRVSN